MKKRLWDDSEGDDPATGLINLFDVWIAFAAALLLAVVSYFNLPKPAPSASTDSPTDKSPTTETIDAARMKIDRFQESQASKSGEGERLGTAYRLKSGEIIYVKDKQKK
ncbi:DUF2149 domain-containing protein [Prosthecobacter sp.]|uniref:DUF2149 domain-containing protein n=1 Tax=Prosthecobacter sp. TaxID=1965333 RepID=UPI0037848E1A